MFILNNKSDINRLYKKGVNMALDSFRSLFLPYCIQQIEENKYVVLNREYKPLGFKTNKIVKYEDYPIVVEIKGLTKSIISKISHNGNEDVGNIYLYDDGCVPTASQKNMEKYLERLAILAKLKTQ